MKKKSTLTLICLCAANLYIQAQQPWTLRNCIAHALEHNVNINRAKNAAQQTEVDVNTAKWSRLPNLNGSVGQNWSFGRSASPVDNTYRDINSANTSFGLSTNVPIFTGLQLSNQYALSKLNLKATLEELNKAKEDLAVNVASSYLQVLFNWELSKVAAQQVVLSQEQLDRLSRLYELGKTSLAQLSEAKAQVAQDEMGKVQAENNYQLALLDLSQLLELPSPEGFLLESPTQDLTFVLLTPPDEIYTHALTFRPEIKVGLYRLEGSEKSLRIAQSSYYPQLSFGAGLGSNFYAVNGNADAFGQQMKHNLNRYVGFNLSVPLFDRLSTRNRVRSARLRQTDIALQLDNTRKTLYKEIQQAWYSAVAAESKYKASQLAVEANQESFRLMSEKYDNGKATAVEYNEAKLGLTRSLSDRIQSKYDYLFRTKILDFYKGTPIE